MLQSQKTLAVNAELVDRLNALAASLDCPQEDLANQAIDQFLEVQAWQLETDLAATIPQASTR